MAQRKSGWRNWGDNPLVVSILVIAAIIGIAVGLVTLYTFVNAPPKNEAQPNGVVLSSATVTPLMTTETVTVTIVPQLSPSLQSTISQSVATVAPTYGISISALPRTVQSKLEELNATGHKVKQIAFTPDAGWVILYDTSGWASEDIPQYLYDKLVEFRDEGQEIKQVAFTPDSGWIVLLGRNGYLPYGMPQKLSDKLKEIHDAGLEIKQVIFTPKSGGILGMFQTWGWLILYGKNGWALDSVPKEMHDKLLELYNRGEEIKQTAFTPDLGWMVLIGRNGWSKSNVPEELYEQLRRIQEAGREIRHITFAPNAGWIVISGP